jgi:hypothetical protein
MPLVGSEVQEGEVPAAPVEDIGASIGAAAVEHQPLVKRR